MALPYARGKRALGICDGCGLRFKLASLKTSTVRGVTQNSLKCSSCRDPDHPQNFQGMYPVYDPQALRVTRPDVPEAPVPAYTPPIIG